MRNLLTSRVQIEESSDDVIIQQQQSMPPRCHLSISDEEDDEIQEALKQSLEVHDSPLKR